MDKVVNRIKNSNRETSPSEKFIVITNEVKILPKTKLTIGEPLELVFLNTFGNKLSFAIDMGI